MADENLFLLYAFLMGVFITFVYDLLRIFRRVVSHNTFWVSVEDLIFWGFCAAEVFLLMYHLSNGTLRWFAVLGALAGMCLYLKTVSRILVKYVSLLLNALFKLLGRAGRFLCTPFRAVGRAAGKAAGKASLKRKRICIFLKKRLTMYAKMFKMVINRK